MNDSKEKKNNGPDNPPGQNITITVNGRPHAVTKQEMSFGELIALSKTPTGPNVSHTVIYRNGHGNKPQGSLTEGETVKLKNEMIFNVSATDKS